ncbi:MAG: ABC transporter permease [Prevotellaceae bacterium]|jgi:ABC-type antimicrobial peptide transport system permease subunit|nr:ABC transporter permease [Prevotellaceae bacterium]
MLLHYIKIAVRNSLKHKTQSIINIVGLAVGFVCMTVSAIWIRYEMTYDTLHPDAENIYRITEFNPEEPDKIIGDLQQGLLAGRLKQVFPEIEAAASVLFYSTSGIQLGLKNLKPYEVDSSFLSIFKVEFIYGNKETAFTNPNSVILTENTAKMIFGSAEQAIGKIFSSDKWGTKGPDYSVSAIIKDFKHSKYPFNALVQIVPNERSHSWNLSMYATFIRLNKSANKEDFFRKLKNVQIKELSATYNKPEHKRYFKAVPLHHIQYKYNNGRTGNNLPFTYIVLMSSISFILFICTLFNYMSLFASKILTRIKELGLRKAVGASVFQLYILLITEFIFSLLLAFFLGACIIEILCPAMEHALIIDIDKALILGEISVVVILSIVVSLVLSAYPIWQICSSTVKHTTTGRNYSKRQYLQNFLIAFQLIVSVFFLFITIVMYRQLHFMQNKDLGLDYKNVILISPDNRIYDLQDNIDIICEELQHLPSVQDVLRQQNLFFGEKGNIKINKIRWDNKEYESMVGLIQADYNFTDFFQIRIKQGRFFSKNFANEKNKILINEKFAKIIGDPLGKKIQKPHTFEPDKLEEFEIIGVIPDIYERSLKHETEPLVIQLSEYSVRLYIRYVPGQAPEVLEQARLIFKKHGIEDFETAYMEDTFNNFSKYETFTMKFISVIAFTCLIISLFGIYSLTLYSMQRRKREVAIRKIMGASVSDIVGMFFKEYLWLVLSSCVIAVPPAYYVMDKWLQEYANRINITGWLMAGVLFFITLIVVLTVLRQIIKAANSNPADVIKYE